MNPIELFALITGVLTLVLLALEGTRYRRFAIFNWPMGIASVIALAWVFYEAKLYPDTLLQLFFLGTGVLGWYNWLHGGENKTELRISTLTNRQRVLTVVGLVVVCVTLGFLWDNFTDAVVPYIDQTIAGMSVVAQVLLMRKKLENWWLWVGVDLIAIPLYWSRGLMLATILYAVYLVLASYSLWSWTRAYNRDKEVEVLTVEEDDTAYLSRGEGITRID